MSLVKCICINDSNRPKEIPADKWVVKGEEYRVLGLYVHVRQGRIQGVTLMEKPLDASNIPYSAFLLSRFGFNIDDIPALIQLAKDCTDLNELNDSDIKELEHLVTRELELVD